jgi:hypothetical protein
MFTQFKECFIAQNSESTKRSGNREFYKNVGFLKGCQTPTFEQIIHESPMNVL